MNINQLLKANKILLLGFGAENKQFLNWLLTVVKLDPNKIVIADQNPDLQNIILRDKSVILNSFQDIKTYSGNNYLDSLKNPEIDYVFKAPGIWSLLPELEEFRKQKGKDKILSNLVFFFEKFRDQITAVTGTKGKSTTCNLTNHFINNLPPRLLGEGRGEVSLVSHTETNTIKNTFQINLPGEHNLMNITQALLITESIISNENNKEKLLKKIIDKKEIYQKALSNFIPIDHRLQLIRTEKLENLTINFYDDGAASEPNAVYEAAKALTEQRNPPSAKGWQTKSDGVVFTQKNQRDSSATVGMTKHTTLNILFSPCGSSFDEFSNYQERAKWWTKKVTQIKP